MEHTKSKLYPDESLLSSSSLQDLQENPAFRFFGKRLFGDQSLPEFLNELLLILFSPKRLAPPHTHLSNAVFPHVIA